MMSNNQLIKPDPNDNAEPSEYSRWRELCGIQLKEKLSANIQKRQKTFEDVVSMAAMKISRDSTLEIISNPPKFKITATITNNATKYMCLAIDQWPGVHLSQCKKLPPIFKKYWRIADNWWNRQKGKYFGDLFFQPILHYSLHRYCKSLLIHKNNDIEYQYLFYIFLHDIIMSQVSFKKARPNPLIFDLALEKSPKLQTWFTMAGEQHGVKWQTATNKTSKKSMKEYSREWVKCVRERKKIEYAKYINGDDISHINNLLSTFHDGSGSMMSKRNSGSRSRSHSHSHSKSKSGSGSYHDILRSHSRNNSNNSSVNHNRTITNNSNISNISSLSKVMNESEMKSNPNSMDDDNDDNMSPDVTAAINIVTDAQREQSSKDYAKLEKQCKELKQALEQQRAQQAMMAQALNTMQMYQTQSHIYSNYGVQPHVPSINYAEQALYEQQLQQQQFNQAMQDFQSQIQAQQQARQYQTAQDFEYIKQEQDDQMNDTPDNNYYGGPDDKSSIFGSMHSYNNSMMSNPGSINQPEFLPQPVAPTRYSMSSAPEYNGRRESGSILPPPLKTDAGKERRQSYHDVLSMKAQFNIKPEVHRNDTDGGLSHTNSVQSMHSLHTNHTNGNSTLTTASQTTILSQHTNIPRQSTPTTTGNTGLSTPSGSDTSRSFFSTHSHHDKYGYNAHYKPSWPHAVGYHNTGHVSHGISHKYAPSHGGGYSYIGGHTHSHHPVPVYPASNHGQRFEYQNQQRQRRREANKTPCQSLDIDHNGSVDVKSVSMASHNSNNNNGNNNNYNNNGTMDLNMHLPPPTIVPMMPQPHPQQPLSPLPSVKQSNNLLPPPTSSRRVSMVSSHHSHQSLSHSGNNNNVNNNNNNNSGAITPPSHSNNNSINMNLANFDDFNMNMIANINSTFSDNNNNDNVVPFDTTAMEMDNMMSNILQMSGSNNMFDAGQTSSQSQNRIFNSVGNQMSVSNIGPTGMSMSNTYDEL